VLNERFQFPGITLGDIGYLETSHTFAMIIDRGPAALRFEAKGSVDLKRPWGYHQRLYFARLDSNPHCPMPLQVDIANYPLDSRIVCVTNRDLI